MPKATTSSRGPIFKHDILSAPLPYIGRTRPTKKDGQPASHRSKCEAEGLSSTNRGKRYLTPAQRREILKQDPTAVLIDDKTKKVWCRVCEETKVLEGDRYLLTGWWNHTDTDKHRENARNHLSPARYLDWLHFVEQHARPKKHKNNSRRRSSSIVHLSPPYSTPPPPYTPSSAPLLPAPAAECYTPSSGSQHPTYYSEVTQHDDKYNAQPPSIQDSFRLRPADWMSSHGPYTYGGENAKSYFS